jgi:hypothetical protein
MPPGFAAPPRGRPPPASLSSNVKTVALINPSASNSPARVSSRILIATSSAAGMVLRPVVEKIVELAKAGVRDLKVLCIDVLAQLEILAQSEACAPSERTRPPMTSAAGNRVFSAARSAGTVGVSMSHEPEPSAGLTQGRTQRRHGNGNGVREVPPAHRGARGCPNAAHAFAAPTLPVAGSRARAHGRRPRRRDGYDFTGKRTQINSSSMISTFTPMHASSSSAADAAEIVEHENSAIFARLSGGVARPVVSSKLPDM